MAKKAMVERELKRKHLVAKYAEKRAHLKTEMKNAESLQEKLMYQAQLQKLPRNSSANRLHNRCMLTGRPKGYLRDFGLSRHTLREMANFRLLPGVTKASW